MTEPDKGYFVEFPEPIERFEFASAFTEAYAVSGRDYLVTFSFRDPDGVALEDADIDAAVTGLNGKPYRYLERPDQSLPVLAIAPLRLTRPAKSVTIEIFSWGARSLEDTLERDIAENSFVRGLSWFNGSSYTGKVTE